MTHEGPTLDTVGEYTVIDCECCRFAHVVPLPTNAIALYRTGYYEEVKPDYFKHQEADRGWWEQVYGERYDWFESWLEPERRRILDVGSGPGLFLHVGRTRKWDGVGLEPAEAAFEYSRDHYGLTVYPVAFDQEFTDANRESFDVVYLSEVLEHLADPAQAVAQAAAVLGHGGLLCLIVPNDYNVFQRALVAAGDQKPWWLAPPHHLNYFTVPSLYALVRRNGFAVADLTCTFPLELFLLMGENYVGNDQVGRVIHGRRKRLELTLERIGLGNLKREVYKAMARRGIGRDIVLLAKKV